MITKETLERVMREYGATVIRYKEYHNNWRTEETRNNYIEKINACETIIETYIDLCEHEGRLEVYYRRREQIRTLIIADLEK